MSSKTVTAFEFWITGTGFRIPLVEFRIPKPKISNSTNKRLSDSRIRITNDKAVENASDLAAVYRRDLLSFR